jgi:hypothetical protein
MIDSNTGYKMIAVASLTAALFSCDSTGFTGESASFAGGSGHNAIMRKLEDIENTLIAVNDRLDDIEGCSNESFLNGECEPDELPNDVAVYSTFCIQQGRKLELAAEYAGGLEIEVEVGPGWAAALHAEAKGEVDFPFFIPPSPVTPPIPVPTQAKIGVEGELGRAMEICVELPVELSDDDEARLYQIALDINNPDVQDARLGGKFQRRAGRILNYAAVRVPGRQRALEMQSSDFSAKNASQDVDGEFDRADAAGDSLLDNGFGAISDGLDVFRDGNIRELLATLEIPVEVSSFMNDPERMFNALPEIRGGEGPILCNEVGISGAIRGRRPRIDGVCARLEDLPAFSRLRSAPDTISKMTDEMVDAVAELLGPLLGNASETAAETKARFCDSRIGKRKVFDRYCGR